MREVLYRGKTDDGEWVYGNLIETKEEYSDEIICAILEKTAEHRCCGEYCDDGWNSVVKDTIGEYIGLTDKNGNKIFEGDILKWDSREWGGEYNEVVRWDYGQFDMRKNDWKEWCEIIGNIHDNPEFLTDKT